MSAILRQVLKLFAWLKHTLGLLVFCVCGKIANRYIFVFPGDFYEKFKFNKTICQVDVNGEKLLFVQRLIKAHNGAWARHVYSRPSTERDGKKINKNSPQEVVIKNNLLYEKGLFNLKAMFMVLFSWILQFLITRSLQFSSPLVIEYFAIFLLKTPRLKAWRWNESAATCPLPVLKLSWQRVNCGVKLRK